jgi:hypothetical protein
LHLTDIDIYMAAELSRRLQPADGPRRSYGHFGSDETTGG